MQVFPCAYSHRRRVQSGILLGDRHLPALGEFDCLPRQPLTIVNHMLEARWTGRSRLRGRSADGDHMSLQAGEGAPNGTLEITADRQKRDAWSLRQKRLRTSRQ